MDKEKNERSKEEIEESKKNVQALIGASVFLAFIIIAKVFFGRHIPYMNNDKVDINADKNKSVVLLSYSTGRSKDVSLGGLEKNINLIPGAYAKRTMFMLRYQGYNGDVKEVGSNVYLDGNLIQSDNFTLDYNGDIYEIFVVDNEYKEDDILKFTIKNEVLFKDKEASISAVKNVWDEDFIYNNPLHLINNSKYIRLPAKEQSSILLLPLTAGEIDKDSIQFVDAVSGKSVDGVNHNLLNLDGSDWSGGLSPLNIKVSATKDINLKNLHLVINETVIPF